MVSVIHLRELEKVGSSLSKTEIGELFAWNFYIYKANDERKKQPNKQINKQNPAICDFKIH